MKGAVDLITLIIVACMVVSIGLMLWFYLSSYYSQVAQSGQNSTAKSLVTLSSCMRIEEASQNNFFVRNCGTGFITINTLNVYVDDNPASFVFSPSYLDAGKTGTLTLQGAWGLSIGQHSLRITNPNVETSALFDAELPDSCVLALDFDEGSGNIAHDSSGHGNSGILNPNVTWTNGKYGKAILLNASLNVSYVTLPNLTLGGTNAVSVEAWIKNTGSNNEMNVFNYGVDTLKLSLNQYGTATFTLRSASEVWYNVQSSQSIPINQYVHLMGTYDGSFIKLYINGVLNQTNPAIGMIRNNDNDEVTCGYTIGGKKDYWASWNWDSVFNGTIDSVRVYNQALTPDQTINFRLI